MSPVTIEESGMVFGPFPDDGCFHVERCRAYLAVQSGVKIAEFVLLRDIRRVPTLLVVEAKSGFPDPQSGERFQCFIHEIQDKFRNTFAMVVAARLGRVGSARDELPPAVAGVDLASISALFVLVIHQKPKEWLPPLQDALAKELFPFAKTWRLSPPAVIVVNDETARDWRLIR
jgi:hypothetical protein